MTTSFLQRAESMGLKNIGNECFRYDDSIGSVIYKHLQTKNQEDVPIYAVYTKPPVENTDFQYVSTVSDLYQFEGNEIMNNKIRESISEIKTPIFREYVFLNPSRTRMSNEILIQNPSNNPKVGDIYPQVVVKNTYDGSGAREFLFGFSIIQNNSRLLGFGFEQKISKIRQVHNTNSRTSMTSSIGGYVELFSKNIMEIIDLNFRTEITEDHLLKVFELIEEVGKKRRKEVSTFLSDLNSGEEKISAWSLFLAITFFSTIEKNVNIKNLLNNIAESVLVIPVGINNVLKTLNK